MGVTKSAKTFILDTNVILHDPTCIHQFQENNIVLPITVIEEVDHFKRGNQVINLNAREFSRMLDSMSKNAIFNGGVSLGKDKGKIKIHISKGISEQIRDVFRDDNADHRVLSVAFEMHSKSKDKKKVVLVSKDVNLRIKAKSLGIQAEDYTTDQIESLDSLYQGKEVIDNFESGLVESFFKAPYEVPIETVNGAIVSNKMFANKYFVLRNGQSSALVVFDKAHGAFKRVLKQSAYGIIPRNVEQTFALDALLNPEIPLVSITGKAGTGKTLLALASSLEARRQYRQIYLARPIIPLGNKDIGYLPGDIESKLGPYMQPLWDNLKVIQDQFGDRDKNHTKIDELVKAEKLIIEPLSYIRGRSLQRIFLIVDEAQNLTPHEVKTIITRAGEGVKIVFTGDIYQIDHPYLDSQSNGLSYLIDHLKGESLYAHVNLEKGERSPLAELASNLL